MPSFLRLTFLAWVLICFTACTAMRPLPGVTPEAIRQEIQVGDEVAVTTTSQQSYTLTVTRIDQGVLYGQDGQQSIAVPLQDVTRLSVSRYRRGATIGLVSVVASVLVVTIAVLAALDRAD